jgi:ATP-dependent Clp protease adaptor protein ClpS
LKRAGGDPHHIPGNTGGHWKNELHLTSPCPNMDFVPTIGVVKGGHLVGFEAWLDGGPDGRTADVAGFRGLVAAAGSRGADGERWPSGRTKMAGGEDDGNDGSGSDDGAGAVTDIRTKTKRPSMYRVLILNDDYTPMEFVVHVLERFFNKQREEATQIMLHVHHHGVGECGIFTYEVAETKVTQVMDFARRHQHPLQCVMEKK